MKRLEAGKGSAAAYSSLDVRTAEMAASNIMGSEQDLFKILR